MKNLTQKITNRRRSLKHKMILFIAGLMLLLSVINLIVGIFTSYNGMIANIRLDLDAMRQIGSEAFGQKIYLLKDEANTISGLPALENLESIEEGLEKLRAYKDDYLCETMSLVDENGIVHSDDATLDGMNISDRDYYKRALNGEVVVGTTVLGINKEKAILPVCAKLHNGTWSALLTYDGNVLSDVIKDITVGKTGNLFALDQTGAFIASKNPVLINTRQNLIEEAKTDASKKTSAQVYSKMVAGETGIANYIYLGKERICAYSPIPGTDGWSFGVVAPLKEMISSLGTTILLMLASTVIMLAVGVIAAVSLANNIANPVAGITDRMELLAEGDLSSDVPVSKSKDEIGVMTNSFAEAISMTKKYVADISKALTEVAKGNFAVSLNQEFKGDFKPMQDAVVTITESLSKTMQQINQSAEQVASGSEQVSAGAQALSQGATQQASSIQELAATINDISGKISDNAENAVQASERAERVGREAAESNERMQDMLKAMDDISASSSGIGKIIKTIEDIAFQTNILALNAAVEAARAGAAGKGFAVVADEVRSLASQSAEASKNTSALIESSLRAVENGTQIAGQTAQALNMVVDGVKEVTEKIDKISQASGEEAESVAQVTIGMDQISSVVQTNSATAEESAAASEELSSQSQLLKELLENFEWDGKGTEKEKSAFGYAGVYSGNNDTGYNTASNDAYDYSAAIEAQADAYTAPAMTGNKFDSYSKY